MISRLLQRPKPKRRHSDPGQAPHQHTENSDHRTPNDNQRVSENTVPKTTTHQKTENSVHRSPHDKHQPQKQKQRKRRERLIKASPKPHLFISNTKKPSQDPVEINEEIEAELMATATSPATFEQLKIHYSSIRSRVIESTKKFRFSSYRLRLGPNPESRTEDIRSYIREVMRRQAVGCRVNIGIGNERENTKIIQFSLKQ